MKLSTMVAKLTKGKVLSAVGALVVAAAAFTAGAPAAQAQVAFGIGVNVGPRYVRPLPRPVVVAPGYAGYGYQPYSNGYGYGGYAPGYGAQRRYDAWRAHEWRERQAWDYRHGYGYGYNGR